MAKRRSDRQIIESYRLKSLEEPRWFFEDFLQFGLLDWQYDFVNAALDVPRVALFKLEPKINLLAKPRITARSCHGTGKTQGMAGLAHIWNFNFYAKIAATAPKRDQLTRRFLPRYRKILKSAPQIYQDWVDVKGSEIDWMNDKDWGLSCETATDPDNLAGYHDTPQLFLIDEASSRRLDPMYSVIEGALTTPGSVCVEIGNPTRMEGEFYQHHNRSALADLYYRMHIKHTDAPEFIDPQWVKTMAIKYGLDSPIYKIRVLGEFADFDSAILIPLPYIEEAYDADFEDDGSLPTLRVSVDVADGGADLTVITVGRKYDSYDHILCQKFYNWEPSVAVLKAADMAENLFALYGGRKAEDDFVVDANGVGAGTAGTLIQKGFNVIRHMGGSTDGVDTDRYRNRRHANHFAMYDSFSQYRVKIDKKGIEDVEKLEAHIMAVKRDSDGDDKRDQIQSAEAVKKDLGESPDCSASLSMWFYGGQTESVRNEASDAGVWGSVESDVYNEDF